MLLKGAVNKEKIYLFINLHYSCLFLSKSWQVYKRNADQLASDLVKAFPSAKVLINDTKPRSKSYELTVIKENGEGW